MKIILISGESGVGKSHFAKLIFKKVIKINKKSFNLENSDNVAILPFASFIKLFTNDFLYISFEKDIDTINHIRNFLGDIFNNIKNSNYILIDKCRNSIKNKAIQKQNFFLYIYALMNSAINYLNLFYPNDLIDNNKIYLKDNDSFVSNILYNSFKLSDIRTFYQYFGTEYIRNNIDNNFHIKVLLLAIEKAKDKGYNFVIVDDLRFPNEKIFMKNVFKENVFHIHIKKHEKMRKNLNEWLKKHESEKYVDILEECADAIFVNNNENKKYNEVKI